MLSAFWTSWPEAPTLIEAVLTSSPVWASKARVNVPPLGSGLMLTRKVALLPSQAPRLSTVIWLADVWVKVVASPATVFCRCTRLIWGLVIVPAWRVATTAVDKGMREVLSVVSSVRTPAVLKAML